MSGRRRVGERPILPERTGAVKPALHDDDPRPSIGERYGSRAAYLDAVRSFARALVTARHVLVRLSCAKVGRARVGLV
jgi:hypothetical protein